MKNDTREENEQGASSLHTAIKPILKYPGAKWSINRWITSFFPRHKHYLEPYCGSAAVFFNKTPAVHEVLNDINGDIVNLFRVMRYRGGELAYAIDMTPWSEEEYHLSEHCCTDGDELENARRFLVWCWQAHGIQLGKSSSGWKHNGLNGRAYPARFWKDLPDRILAAVDRLKDAEIRNRPALELIAYYNDPECLIYGDPPYILSTRLSQGHYTHEMTDDEHIALLNALDVHRGPVILSGYEHPLYTNRLQGWHKVTTPAVTEHGNTRMEVLWLNQKAAQTRQMPLFSGGVAV